MQVPAKSFHIFLCKKGRSQDEGMNGRNKQPIAGQLL
jgi:hypothetical protein